MTEKELHCTLEVDNSLEVGGLYRHFKGGIYEIIDFATCTKTLDTLVIYRSYGESKLWTRSILEFLEMLDTKKHHGARFERLLL